MVNSLNLTSFLKFVKNPRILGQIHAQMASYGETKSVYTCNNLIKAYTSMGLISHAQRLFNTIPDKNIVSWTILISGFTKRGLFNQALDCFREMLLTGLQPNEITFSTILPIFVNLDFKLMGKSCHGFWVRRLYDHNVITETCIVNMYSKFGLMNVAQIVFDEMPVRNVASWNVIISGYADNGMGAEAFSLFNLMREDVGFVDHFTIMSLISAVTKSSWSVMSSAIHGLIVKSGYSNEQQVETGLIKMYTKCNFIDEAHCVFCEMSVRDVVAWTLMLDGFLSCREWSKAIEHFSEMMSLHGRLLDSIALVSILSCCSKSGDLLHGKRVHALIVKRGFSNDVFVGCALIDMYTNVGDLESGKRYFDGVDEKDVVCWNAMIKAMGANGNGVDAVDLLRRMEASGFNPNESTLISVLSACSHAGMIDEGLEIFCHMIERWGIIPNSQHYACLVDMLGRSGRLDEAYSMMNEMPMKPHIGVYGALLSACKIYGNTKMGADIFQQLLKLDLKDAGHVSSVLNMYASVGDWEGVKISNVALRLNGVKKVPGCSFTELNDQVCVS